MTSQVLNVVLKSVGFLSVAKLLILERETGLEPATSSLGSWHSTTELLPLALLLFYLPVFKGLRPLYRESIPSIASIQNHFLTAKWTVKWTVNQSGKTRLPRSRLLSTLLSIPRQIHHITLDLHPGRTSSPTWGSAARAERALRRAMLEYSIGDRLKSC